ncbi:MAG: DegV family protein [Lachnospiraceae bacterium]|nr:DegV family protein [Lachnospiraceae bacterium]
MVKFIADSSCDKLSFDGVEYESVPLTIYTDEKSYLDDENIDVHEMLEYLAGYHARSYTSCPSAEAWLSAFEGGDEIYVATLTSGLSGTYNSANVAKDMYLAEHPEAKIHVIDSLSTGPELHLIMEKLIQLKNEGNTFEEVIEKINSYMKKTRLLFAFFSLHNFAQNGRVSKVVASAIGMLNIRVIGTADEEGKVGVIAKCRGEKKMLQTLMEEIEKAGYKGGKFRISHVENESLANTVINMIKEKYADADTMVYPAKGLCSYYAERHGIILGFEC